MVYRDEVVYDVIRPYVVGSAADLRLGKQEAHLPQRNSASTAHVYLGWLTDRAMHRTPQNHRGCIIV